jgi:transposase
MWTEEHRRIYRREGGGYPSDLRDAEWTRLEPLIPPARPGGRPRKTDMRAAVNAILYLLRTGSPTAAALDGLQHLSQVPV